jgi:ribosomal protein S8
MINEMNMSKETKICKTTYSKFKLRILEHIKEKGTVNEYNLSDDKRFIHIKLNQFTKIKLVEPYNLGYNAKELTQIKTHLDKLYGGYMVVNSDKGLINESRYGGKILFYVY